MKPHRLLIGAVLILALSLSCQFLNGPETPSSPVAPNMDVPAVSPTPVPPTTTPVPAGLNPTGPHVLYGTTQGIWISNPDGSFLTRITDIPLDANDLRGAVSPQGDRLALITKNDAGLDLVEVMIPGGETKTLAHLHSITHDERISYPTSDIAFAAYAIGDYANVAWQPGTGRYLAFVGAIEGPTSDLYLYDTQTGEISRLTDGDSQAILPRWSPDGQYILHFGVSWVPPFGGAIVGFNHLDGAFSVRLSDQEVINMPVSRDGNMNFAGWLDESHYLTYDSDMGCSTNLRSVDVSTGKTQPIMDSSFYAYIAISPQNKALLFSSDSECQDSPGEGVFMLLPGEGSPTQILDKKAWGMEWSPESQFFFAYPEAMVSADGLTRYLPPVHDHSYDPAVSKNGYQAWEVIENREGRTEVMTPGAEWKTVLRGSIDGLIWDPISGDTLLMVLEDGSLYAASYPDFQAKLMGSMGVGSSEIIWLP